MGLESSSFRPVVDVREYDKVSRYILHIEFKLGRGGARNSPTQGLRSPTGEQK